MNDKEISFCIVCRNRIKHLQQTLIPNIKENEFPGVEFILLDYNSDDELEEWVKTNLQKYLKTGILIYYRNTTALFFHRSHSRNMVMRLSTGQIICNLDADNYLGYNFTPYLLNIFKNNNNIFVTSDYSIRDSIGRVCMRRQDFLRIKGYNEVITGYGFEDVELYYRLQKSGLKQIYVDKPEFFKAITHSNKMRISQEELYSQNYQLYIQYITPYQSDFLLLYENQTFIKGQVTNNFNKIFNVTDYENMDKTMREVSDYRRVVLSTPVEKGLWINKGEESIECRTDKSIIKYQINSTKNTLVNKEKQVFYKILDSAVCDLFIMTLSEAINYIKILDLLQSNSSVNPLGFGKGIVFKNFNKTKPIIL